MDYRRVAIHPQARVAPNATIIGDVTLEKDALVLFNATLRGDCGSRIVIGEGSNIQENCCVHVSAEAPCIVGKGVTIGHGAIVHGCTICDNCLVGMGAIVMDGAVIGENSIVAAGALVTGGTRVPAGSLVMGSPAKVRRELTAAEVEQNRASAAGYVAVGKDLVENGVICDGASLPAGLATIAATHEEG